MTDASSQPAPSTLDGAAGIRFVVPLENVSCPVCDLTIQTGEGLVRTTIGIVPLRPK